MTHSISLNDFYDFFANVTAVSRIQLSIELYGRLHVITDFVRWPIVMIRVCNALLFTFCTSSFRRLSIFGNDSRIITTSSDHFVGPWQTPHFHSNIRFAGLSIYFSLLNSQITNQLSQLLFTSFDGCIRAVRDPAQNTDFNIRPRQRGYPWFDVGEKKLLNPNEYFGRFRIACYEAMTRWQRERNVFFDSQLFTGFMKIDKLLVCIRKLDVHCVYESSARYVCAHICMRQMYVLSAYRCLWLFFRSCSPVAVAIIWYVDENEKSGSKAFPLIAPFE